MSTATATPAQGTGTAPADAPELIDLGELVELDGSDDVFDLDLRLLTAAVDGPHDAVSPDTGPTKTYNQVTCLSCYGTCFILTGDPCACT